MRIAPPPEEPHVLVRPNLASFGSEPRGIAGPEDPEHDVGAGGSRHGEPLQGHCKTLAVPFTTDEQSDARVLTDTGRLTRTMPIRLVRAEACCVDPVWGKNNVYAREML
jgi:hypothetical protein